MRSLFILSLFALLIVTPTQAEVITGMTAEQLRAEIARLEQVAATIRAKLAELGAGTTTGVCLKTNVRMQRGVSGPSVLELQNFLVQEGVYSPDLVTGYFGPATEAGVQRWQALNEVINYGTPYTTGYGLVGPATLRAMQRGCPGGIYSGPNNSLTSTMDGTSASKPTRPAVPVEKYSLSLNPTKGLAPLAVTASFNITGSTCTSYELDWGDGRTPVVFDSGKSDDCISKTIRVSRSHVYNRYGTYNVTFRTGKGPLSDIKILNTIEVESLPNL